MRGMSDDFVVVFGGSVPEADIVKGLLESAGIKAFLDSEAMASTLPIAVDFAGDEAGRVVVAQSDEERALEVIKSAHDANE